MLILALGKEKIVGEEYKWMPINDNKIEKGERIGRGKGDGITSLRLGGKSSKRLGAGRETPANLGKTWQKKATVRRE